ncbi:MAG TPA: MarR family winged helix-turn-helix transcriptional regulator [Gaiellaceae bacterium]|nr:MarR family winged helix-turn-helix transcriptional regulator [Gaiellaceae bacterium]
MVVTEGSKKKPARMPRELATSPAFLLKRIGALVKEQMAARFEEAGALPYDYAVLSLLAQGACATQAMIADTLRYDRSYLVGLLDDLERRGLVERKRDQNDRRRHVVSLTRAGGKELDRLRDLHDMVEFDVLAPLTGKERETLRALLTKVATEHDERYALDK